MKLLASGTPATAVAATIVDTEKCRMGWIEHSWKTGWIMHFHSHLTLVFWQIPEPHACRGCALLRRYTSASLTVLIGVIQLNCHGLEGNGLSFLYTLPRSNSVLRRNQISPPLLEDWAMARMWGCRLKCCVCKTAIQHTQEAKSQSRAKNSKVTGVSW